jgi:23S rRNA (adenine2503-C2)-methyltransferase
LKNFYDLTASELADYLLSKDIKKFRAQQLYKWIYGQGETDFDKMTDISKSLRSELPSLLSLDLPKMLTEHISKDGTCKYLFDMGEGRSVESVLIPSGERLTLCVSSEVGCNMACKFCYTAKQKLQRRLKASEIVGQLLGIASKLPQEMRVTNVVFMGMGEPLDNSDEVFRSIEIMHHSWGLNMSRKKITVSTSGIVPEMHKVAESGARLAVSLNGVNDEVRSRIMPINKRWPLADLLQACRDYCDATGDRVTLEYVLIKGVTDAIEDAYALYELTKDIPCKINIIPFNEHPNSGFQRPSERAIQRFQQALMDAGSHVLRRKTMGRDIYAACGQLTTVAKQ